MTEEIHNIKTEIEQIEARKAALQAELASRTPALIAGIVERIRVEIDALGIEFSDIATHFGKPKRGRKAKNGGTRSDSVYPVYRLPSDHEKIYTRGVLPAWMRDDMVARGLDPANKEHRAQYKETVLVKEAA